MVLIHESDARASVRIEAFCDRLGLIGPRQNVMDALKANIDLGGVFLAGTGSGPDLGRRIHQFRPELPILFDHRDGSISFGAGDPQLRFHYTLDRAGLRPYRAVSKINLRPQLDAVALRPARTVDDSSTVRNEVSGFLAQHGYKAAVASDGRASLDGLPPIPASIWRFATSTCR